jgi:hypothetical protein
MNPYGQPLFFPQIRFIRLNTNKETINIALLREKLNEWGWHPQNRELSHLFPATPHAAYSRGPDCGFEDAGLEGGMKEKGAMPITQPKKAGLPFRRIPRTQEKFARSVQIAEI